MDKVTHEIVEHHKNLSTPYNIDYNGHVNTLEENLLEIYSNWPVIKKEFNKGKGNELEKKFMAVHSSSALCVNNFALVKLHKDNISLFNNSNFKEASFEKILNTNISKPNLDFFLENDSISIGIESKFKEYFTKKLPNHENNLEKYYKNRKLNYLPENFNELINFYMNYKEGMYLDVAQLLKHSIGLIKRNIKNNKNNLLIY